VLKAGFQGEPGAFSEEAVLKYFGKRVQPAPLRSFDDVFVNVHNGKFHYGVIPIENSVFGSIHQNYDLLQRHKLFIVGEIKLRISHALLANRGVSLRDVKYVYSHQQAIGQCEKYLKTLRKAEAVAVYDTAGAAKMIGEEKRTDAAAIASVRSAQVYGLKILKRGIETDPKNFTRFLILSRTPSFTATKNAKTSIVFSMKDQPGALHKSLSVFALRDINLHKIESRPFVGKPWEYLFYVDFEGNVKEQKCKLALRHLSELTNVMKVLGTYSEDKTAGI
jgi:prephenate dehydratase